MTTTAQPRTELTPDTPCTKCGTRLGAAMARRGSTEHFPQCPPVVSSNGTAEAKAPESPETAPEQEPPPRDTGNLRKPEYLSEAEWEEFLETMARHERYVQEHGRSGGLRGRMTVEEINEQWEREFQDPNSSWYGKRDVYEGKATEQEGQTGNRWIDLDQFLDGTYTPPQPSVGGERDDGYCFLYPGRWHTASDSPQQARHGGRCGMCGTFSRAAATSSMCTSRSRTRPEPSPG
jgi:hypothetical protein